MMKSKTNAFYSPLKVFVLLYFVVLLIVAGCKKDQSIGDDVPNTTINQLKGWYGAEKAKSNNKSGALPGLTPVWGKVVVLEDEGNMVYEVELINSNHLFTADKRIDKSKYKEYEKRNSFRLVLIKDKNTAQVSGAYMNILLENNDQDLQKVHYKKATNFTGTIQYYNINGTYNMGWHYTKGRIDKKYISLLRSASGASTEKEPACGVFPVMGTICVGGDDDPPVCTTSVVGTTEIDCYPIEGGGGTGGGNGGGGGSSGGGFGPGGGGGNGPGGGGTNNYGVDPNCVNCQISDSNLDAFVTAARAAGLTVKPAFHTTLTTPNGSQYEGMMTQLTDANGVLTASYFSPDSNSGQFLTGNSYNIGNNDSSGTINTNSTAITVYDSPFGQTFNFVSLYPPDASGGGTAVYSPDYTYYYSENEMIDFVSLIQDPITGNGIDLYLILNYKGSKLLDLSKRSTSNTIDIGSYTLMAHYDKSVGGSLLFYSAARLGNGVKNGIEYIIRADQLNAFRANIAYYTSAADLVYMNGIPSKGMIQTMAGERISGLGNLWVDALKSPEYWVYLINCFIIEPSNPKVRDAVEESIPVGAAYTRSSLEFGQRMHAEYKLADVIPGVAIKEYRGINGIRPDFVDFNTRTIFELKPNNPRQISAGNAQLAKYKIVFENQYPGTTWNTILNTY